MSLIACCLCGTQIVPNEAAMCMDCLRMEVDVTLGIARKGDLIQCGKCDQWCVRKDTWAPHDLESASLLALCLKKIAGLDKPGVKVLDAVWVWTEPHSKRLKVAVDIECPVLDGKLNLRQKVVVEFVVHNKQCLDCIRGATDHTWEGLVQVRQRVDHKSTFGHLEACLIKAGMHDVMSDVQVTREGMDLFFKHKNQAARVADFISSIFPVKAKSSKKLVSADHRSNTQRYEYVFVIEIVPVNRGDLIITPKESGRPAELMIVSHLTSVAHLVSPVKLLKQELTAAKYFSKPFMPLLTTRSLTKFIVLDIRPSTESFGASTSTSATSAGGGKGVAYSVVKDVGGVLAEAEVARECDFGRNDTTFIIQTHLGHVLKAGDTAWGYDLANAVVDIRNESSLEKLSYAAPDVVLVRKYEEVPEGSSGRRRRKRRGGGGSSSGRGRDAGDASTASDMIDGEEEDYEEEEGEETAEGVFEDDAVQELQLLDVEDDDDTATGADGGESRYFDKYTFEEEA